MLFPECHPCPLPRGSIAKESVSILMGLSLLSKYINGAFLVGFVRLKVICIVERKITPIAMNKGLGPKKQVVQC